MIATLYRHLASLTLGLWLMGGVMLLLAIASFTLSGEPAAAINHLPLLFWLRAYPLHVTWWLWAALGLLGFLGLNTVLCSIEAIRSRWGKVGLPSLVAPHLVHAGFLLILLAHLLSARGSFSQQVQVVEGGGLTFPDGSRLTVSRIDLTMSPMGFPLDYSAQVLHRTAAGTRQTAIRPNHPYFHGGYGIYLKDAGEDQVRGAILEAHREPGARTALAGALLFLAGNLVVVFRRR
jgi:hypothetical protein